MAFDGPTALGAEGAADAPGFAGSRRVVRETRRLLSPETSRSARQSLKSQRPSGAQLRDLLFGKGLFGRFLYLVATQVVIVLLGAGYWAVSARNVEADRVGITSAAVSVGALLSAIGVLGLTSSLLVLLNNVPSEKRRALVTTAVMVASGVVGVCGFGVWALSPVLGPSLRALGRDPVASLLFVAGAMLTGATSVVDAASLGMSRSITRLVRNILASGLRVAAVGLVVIFHMRTVSGLLIGWDVSLAISLCTWPLLRLKGGVRPHLQERLALIREYGRFSLGHHVVNLALGSVTYFLPLIAALIVLPRQLAYFSLAQVVASSSLLLPFLLSMSLFVESTGNAALLRQSIRKTFPVGLVTCVGVLVIFEPGAHAVLSLFSPEYAANGTTPLRLLLIGGLPYVVKDHLMAARRAQNRLRDAAMVGAIATLGELAAAAVGGVFDGLDGLCIGWALACVLEAFILFPALFRILNGTDVDIMNRTP